MQLYIIIVIFVLTAIIRLIALKISIRNEQNLLKEGAIEYGKKITKLIVFVHTLAYLMFFTQGIINVINIKTSFFDNIFYLGIIIYLFSVFFLIIVIRILKRFWTVKIYVSPTHIINNSFLFKYIKHPNYYLNIIPEIIALAMIAKAWESLSVILPIYVVLLYIRIKQEKKALSKLK